jgi:ADP-heptose:LPS heptosyltransferase
MSPLWVFHRGALGDSVLLWPLLRAARAQGRAVTLVTDGSKARLAQAELGIAGLDAEQARFNSLWREDASATPIAGVAEVLTFDASPGGVSRTWLANAAQMFPGATIRAIPERPDRHVVDRLLRDFGPEPPLAPRPTPGGPVVIHLGAGSPQKRWALPHFRTLANCLREAGHTVRLIAGEAEVNQPSTPSSLEDWVDGSFLTTLDELAEALRPARLFIGCDTGPTHLAAQLGVSTLALFGPTDPGAWAPAGPRVRVLAPPAPAPMDWLSPGRALEEALALLALP